MLIKRSESLNLERPIPFLEGIVTLGERFAIFSFNPIKETTDILFFDAERKLVKSIPFQGEIKSFGTINKLEVFFLLPESGEWVIINSSSFAEEKGKFNFLNQSPTNSHLLFFPDSKMIGIWEVGAHKKKEGRLTFLPYPTTESGKAPWVINEIGFYNSVIHQVNNRNLVALFDPKAQGKIKWTIFNLETQKQQDYEINKPENGDYDLRQVIELRPDVYLLEIDSVKPEFRYMVYNHSQAALKPIKVTLSEHVFKAFSLGSWLYFIESNVAGTGVRSENTISVVSKISEQVVFTEKVEAGNDYYANISDFSVIRNDSGYHNITQLNLQTVRATSQKELYVHMVKEITKSGISHDMVERILESFSDD